MGKIIFIVIAVLYAVVCFMMCYLVIDSNKPKDFPRCYVERYADGSLWLGVNEAFRKRHRFMFNSRIRLSEMDGLFEYFGLNEKDFDNLKWGDDPVEVFIKNKRLNMKL